MTTNRKKEKYPTWKEAAIAAGKLGIKTKDEYLLHHHKDPLLPGNLGVAYRDFPGQKSFRQFFWGRKGQKQRKTRKYPTYREARRILKKEGVLTKREYDTIREKLNLPPNPGYTYGTRFPGWIEFLKHSFWAQGRRQAA